MSAKGQALLLKEHKAKAMAAYSAMYDNMLEQAVMLDDEDSLDYEEHEQDQFEGASAKEILASTLDSVAELDVEEIDVEV